MSKKHGIVFLCVMVLIAIVALVHKRCATDGNYDIRIACNVPITGDLGTYGEAIRDGMLLAQADLKEKDPSFAMDIDFEDNVEHRQLFAQALHLFNTGERFWLDNEEIATLIKENEPYQKLNDLVEMIGEAFRKPKASEGRWWGLTEIHELLKNRFANYDPKTSFHKLGRALSDQSFDFETDRKTTGHVYRLVER